MLNQLLKAFSVKTLRDKILITLGLCIVYRLGSHVPVPFISPAKLNEMFNKFSDAGGQGFFNVVDMFSGGAFRQMTIFALGIMPYISASIILQLLTVVWPRLEKMMKEQGEAGRRKINQWTRYGTVVLSLFQGMGIGVWLLNENLSVMGSHRVLFIITTALTLSAGTSFVMWLGEKITEHGIGNGISMIIAVGIIAEYPQDFRVGFSNVSMGLITPISFILVIASLILLTALIIVNQQATRKIPVQHARGRMVGRKMVQGGSTFLPLKLNMAGVIPVIFASSLLTFPQMLFGFIMGGRNSFFADWLSQSSNHNLFNLVEGAIGFSLPGGIFNLLKVINLWTIFYVLLTAFFCYFYTAITFNPVDLADNLKKSGAFIPGRKPGKQTSEYINHILVRITIVGALILIVVALVPDIFTVGFSIPFQFAKISGGTGLIIVVGVMLETMKQIESQLLMRHYEGFRYRGGSGGGRRVRR